MDQCKLTCTRPVKSKINSLAMITPSVHRYCEKQVKIMAKPIEPTPVLRGKDAIRFLLRMKKKEAEPTLSKIEKEFLKQVKQF